MSKVLIKCSDNWADEMDIEGFMIMDSNDWSERKKAISKITKSFNLCIGSNEDIEYRNGNDFLKRFTVKKITDEDANVIVKYLGDSFGHNLIDAADYLDIDCEEDNANEII